jgi:hypothetical protein
LNKEFLLAMINIHSHKLYTVFLEVTFLLLIRILLPEPLWAQGGRYWDQNLNSEAALLSGAVVAGESGIAAIFYNPATISEMTRNNLSLSANLFSVSFFNARNALGADFPADRTQLDIYPRIITLTLNPKKKPELTIEMAYFAKTNDYYQINQGTSLTNDIVSSNPGNENYTADFYLRSKFQDYYGGAGFGYKLSNSLAIGFSGMISYKDDQFYNLVAANVFSPPEADRQYLSDASYHLKYNMFDVRLITKLGIHLGKNLWKFGANISFPSIKIFGDGTVVKQYDYANIHKEAGNPESFNTYYGGRQRKCASHFKDPLSVAAGANYYTPSGNTILLFTAEYFFGLPAFDYIEAHHDPGEEGYNYSPVEPEEWLSFTIRQKPVFNAGVACKQHLSDKLMVSGGFRTDFNYIDPAHNQKFPESNNKTFYIFDVYHINYGLGLNFKRGSITLGMQFSHGRANDQPQVVNLTDPVEFISESQMPLTGAIKNNVQIRYNDISVYIGFMFNFLKETH